MATRACGRRGFALVFVGILGQLGCFVEGSSELETFVVEAHNDNVTRILQSVPESTHVLFEFYAHWCPHCTHFKPTYDAVGAFFMKPPRVQPEVFVVRIDCALKANQKTCSAYDVTGYPTVHFGLPRHFLDKDLKSLKLVTPRKKDSIVKAIGEMLYVDYNVQGASTRGGSSPEVPKAVEHVRKENNRQVHLGDMERSTVEIFDHILSNRALLHGAEQRKGLLDFLTLLSVAHPSTRCQMSAQHLAAKFDELWPQSQAEPVQEFRKFRMCTNQFKTMEWVTCKGSKPDSRGFTCGLWSLMHSMAVKVPDSNGAKLWHAGISGFIRNFFGCKVCADHFFELLQTPDAVNLVTREDVTLWLWRVHNQVNARLAREEAKDGTGDPDFPKIQWPSREQCPLCSVPGPNPGGSLDWNGKEVFVFLINFYQDPTPLPVQRERWMGNGQETGEPEGAIAAPSKKAQAQNVSLGRKALNPDVLAAVVSENSVHKFSHGTKRAANESGVGLIPIACVVIAVVVMFTLRGKFNKLARPSVSKRM